MKKFILILALAVIPAGASASFEINLRYGDKSDAVMELQEFLVDQGLMTAKPTGNFYALTLRAVKAFQAREAIVPVSGFFGPLTRAKANSILAEDLKESNTESAKYPEPVQSQPVQPLPTQSTGTTMQPDTAPASQARIEIVSPFPGKGLGRQYNADPNDTQDRNYIELGAVLYNDDGSINQTADMAITVDSPSGSSNKVLQGTGNYAGFLKVFYYPLHLDFVQAGDYKVTFTANGLTSSVTINVK